MKKKIVRQQTWAHLKLESSTLKVYRSFYYILADNPNFLLSEPEFFSI